MKHFIIVKGRTGVDIAIPIEGIKTIYGEREYNVIVYGPESKEWYVKDKVEDVVRRINEVENNLKRW